MICAPRPAQIVSVSAIAGTDRYEVLVDIDGQQEALSIGASMLDMLSETWPALKAGEIHSVRMKGERKQ
ncbi:MAG: hypothetical protein ACR652_00575 [Methylocystis sp.]|uniref:hypothetical protein n=1 Tax=Methylocystis sp. TaxID=1911079 RepID=UPI003DA6127D